MSPLHQPLDLRPVPDEDRDRAHDPGVGSELAADDIIYDAVAKREARERRRAEAEAEGGSLSAGIGADEP